MNYSVIKKRESGIQFKINVDFILDGIINANGGNDSAGNPLPGKEVTISTPNLIIEGTSVDISSLICEAK